MRQYAVVDELTSGTVGGSKITLDGGITTET
jgi:hypothetical protein